MTKCIPILVLLAVSLTIIIGLLYLEQDYSSQGKINESFISGSDNYNASNRGGENLIQNGNFQNKEDIEGHYGHSNGNQIVSYPNPGKGEYVLKQSTSLQNSIAKYKISVHVKGGQYYKLSSWVYDTKSKKISDMYRLGYHLSNNNTKRYLPKAVSLETTQNSGNIWTNQTVVFQVPQNSTGALDIILLFDSNKHSGVRYITDVKLQKYHPLLRDFPLSNHLVFFLSSSIEKGFSKEDGKLWKDISNNGKDFEFTQITKYTGNSIVLGNNMIIGPPCSELGIKVNQFTIGWYMKSNHQNGKKVIMRLFTSAENGSSLDISYVSHHNSYSSIQVNFLGLNNKWQIGLTGNLALYQLTYNGEKFNLYKDGLALMSIDNESDQETPSNQPTTSSTSLPSPSPTPNKTLQPTSSPTNLLGGDTDKYGCRPSAGQKWCAKRSQCLPIGSCPNDNVESFTSNHGQLYFINKPMLVNPNKDIDGEIYNIFALNIGLDSDQVEQIHKYFQCNSCQSGGKQSPTTSPTLAPPSDHPIHTGSEDICDYERRCKIYQEEKQRKPTPTKNPDMINSLIKAFNNKEQDNVDTCTKIVYNIKPDGRVVKKTMRIPNCQECEGDSSTSNQTIELA